MNTSKITVNGATASLVAGIICSKRVMLLSYLDRSIQAVKAVAAGLQMDSLYYDGRRIACGSENETYISTVVDGKEKFYHAVTLSKSDNFILTTEERKTDDVYSYLMNKYGLPLLKEFIPEIMKWMSRKGYLTEKCDRYGDQDAIVPMGTDKVAVKDIICYSIFVNEGVLEKCVSELLSNKSIAFGSTRMKPVAVTDKDEYQTKFGRSIVENLSRLLTPVSEHTQWMDGLLLNSMRLYPQQVSEVNGCIEAFLQNRTRYAILNMGMGVGKTIQSLSVVEGFFVRKAMKAHHASSEEVYAHPEWVNYRVVVMCPGHLVKKWCSEAQREIPYAKATAITEFSQLLKLREQGKKRNGREIFVISKDFSKLSYSFQPAVRKQKKKMVSNIACPVCGDVKPCSQGKDNMCHKCGKPFVKSVVKKLAPREGMVCPKCGELLFPVNRRLDLNPYSDTLSVPLMAYDFATRTTGNDHCYYCGEELWQPCVTHLNAGGEFSSWVDRANPWKKVTHYANKAHKSRKTVWVHKQFEEDYYSMTGERPLGEKEDVKGARKYAPAQYIKKYLKDFFDFAVFDEMHLYKGGATAQGNSMHALIKASRYQLGLTGTIAGGYANHLFYTLFRLDPARMISHGFSWTSEMAFCEMYGTVEKTYAVEESTRYNTTSRGKQLSSPKVKPGISPLIFTDFLLDKAVFLDLSDMSRFLPPLKEKVVTVPLEDDILAEYNHVVEVLKGRSRMKDGRSILSVMLQFSLSYSDKPYGASVIKSAVDGSDIILPESFYEYGEGGKLLNKEKKLVELVNSELGEGRNCMIYAEYTASPETCVTYRLKNILQNECGLGDNEVVILESTSPSAIEREEWIHRKAQEGAKVFITNPKCVETGLDLCFRENGVEHNYPTLIFYQLGYSLFTIWQASRRHFRLNQTKECRTYYMASEGTIQTAVIQLIAEKQVATAAIQGHFSAEGLAAMARGVDTRVRLAAALSCNDTKSGNALQQMFDVLAKDTDDTDLSGYTPMPLFKEVFGTDAPEAAGTEMEAATEAGAFEAFDILNNILFSAAMINDMGAEKANGVKENTRDVRVKDRKCEKMGIVSLFNFI